MTDPYKYQSLADAYESIYESAKTNMALNGVHKSADAYHKPEQNDRAATSYAKARDKKMADRKAATLKVEAADLAYVINALIEDGTITPDRVKKIMTEKMDPNRMAQYETEGSKEIKRQMEMAKNKGKTQRTPTQKQATRAAISDKATPAQQMARAHASHNTRPDSPVKAD